METHTLTSCESQHNQARLIYNTNIENTHKFITILTKQALETGKKIKNKPEPKTQHS